MQLESIPTALIPDSLPRYTDLEESLLDVSDVHCMQFVNNEKART